MTVGQQYKIVGEIGSGGMGVVYQAVDLMLEREVALKRLRNEFSRTPDTAERFRKEARIQASLNHPNIAQLYTFLKDGDSFYMVMEFVNGTPLSGLLPMPWQEAVRLTLQMLESLEYAHGMGILHRDIKPDNIMVTPKGQTKIMDFGIAHVLGGERLTREKSIIGTLEYMAPERISGNAVEKYGDIYSMGFLLYEMITGQLPFVVQNEFELLHHHLHTPPPKIAALVPEVPDVIEQAFARAAAKKSTDRFASCREMAAFLAKGLPEVAALTAAGRTMPPDKEEAEVKRCRRRIEALIAGGEVLVAERVLATAVSDYPGRNTLAGLSAKIQQEKQKAAGAATDDERLRYARETFQRFADLAAKESWQAGSDLAGEALDRFPRITGFRLAGIYFRGKLKPAA